MYTVINNTQMSHVVTTSSMEIAMAWAETIPYQNDFSIVTHFPIDLKVYSNEELVKLYTQVTGRTDYQEYAATGAYIPRPRIVHSMITALNDLPDTSEMPQDAKRVAPLINPTEEVTMNTSNKVVSKKAVAATPATPATPAKKAAAPKAEKAPKVVAPKIERTKQNGTMLPKPGSKAGQCWAIADALAKKAGAPPQRADVVEACVKAGLSKAGCSADFQAWRKFHGLVNLPKPAKPAPAPKAPKAAPAEKAVAAKAVTKKVATKKAAA